MCSSSTRYKLNLNSIDSNFFSKFHSVGKQIQRSIRKSYTKGGKNFSFMLEMAMEKVCRVEDGIKRWEGMDWMPKKGIRESNWNSNFSVNILLPPIRDDNRIFICYQHNGKWRRIKLNSRFSAHKTLLLIDCSELYRLLPKGGWVPIRASFWEIYDLKIASMIHSLNSNPNLKIHLLKLSLNWKIIRSQIQSKLIFRFHSSHFLDSMAGASLPTSNWN